jgi:hypothetical protein
MGKPYVVSINVSVTNPKALHAHALALATAGRGGLSTAEAENVLGSADAPKLEDCLRWVFDPGTSPPGVSILDSGCEEGA